MLRQKQYNSGAVGREVLTAASFGIASLKQNTRHTCALLVANESPVEGYDLNQTLIFVFSCLDSSTDPFFGPSQPDSTCRSLAEERIWHPFRWAQDSETEAGQRLCNCGIVVPRLRMDSKESSMVYRAYLTSSSDGLHAPRVDP